MLRIGVVGYSDRKFDVATASYALNQLFDRVASRGDRDVVVVSGLTDVGIPAIAYRIARGRGVEDGWRVVFQGA